MPQQPPFIARVQRTHAIVALLATLLTVALARPAVWSAVLAGTLVGAGNFHVLALLTTRLIAGTTSSKQAAVGLLVLKFIGLIAVLGAIVTWLKPDALSFLIALTLAPLCLLGVVLHGRGNQAALADAKPSALEVR